MGHGHSIPCKGKGGILVESLDLQPQTSGGTTEQCLFMANLVKKGIHQTFWRFDYANDAKAPRR